MDVDYNSLWLLSSRWQSAVCWNGLKWWLTRSKLVGMLIWRGSRNVKWDIAHVLDLFYLFFGFTDSILKAYYYQPGSFGDFNHLFEVWVRETKLSTFDKRLFLNTSGSAFFQLHLGPDMALMVTALVNTVPWKLSSQYANLMTRSVGRPYHDLLQSAFSGNPPQVEASAAEIWSPGIFHSRQPPVIVVWFLAMLTSATPSTASCRSDVLSLLCP